MLLCICSLVTFAFSGCNDDVNKDKSTPSYEDDSGWTDFY